MVILGITAPLSWNSAAAIIKDGKFLAAVEEERFIGIKHAPRMPAYKSIEFCLSFAKVGFSEIDAIAFGYRSPFVGYFLSLIENLKEGDFARLLREGGAFAEYYVGLVRLKEWLVKNGVDFKKTKIFFIPHHVAHAASAYRCSGFTEANIISLDGQGENDAGLVGMGRNGEMKSYKRIGHHQSLGWVYGDATDLLGFKSHSHEGKVMGLAAYGKRRMKFNDYWKVDTDSYRLESGWNAEFWRRFGPRRNRGKPLIQRHEDIAYMVQQYTEKVGVALAKKLHKKTHNNNFCVAGGVALNCNMNGKIWYLPITKNIFVQPAANDAGTAIGAAMEVAHNFEESADFEMRHAYWGPEYSNEEIEKLLKEAKVSYKRIVDIEEVCAQELAIGKILGWFQGRLELGSRALGGRSILAHPGLKGIKNKINNEVKHRESWRPFAPSILHEVGEEYFEKYNFSPFMTVTFRVKEKAKKHLSQAIHIDNTARIQSVTKEENPRFHALIRSFAEITGIPAVLNTSFNDSEQPLVNTPKDALRVFMSTGIDVLAVGDFLLEKKG